MIEIPSEVEEDGTDGDLGYSDFTEISKHNYELRYGISEGYLQIIEVDIDDWTSHTYFDETFWVSEGGFGALKVSDEDVKPEFLHEGRDDERKGNYV